MKQIIPHLTRARRLLLIALISALPFFTLVFRAKSERASMDGQNIVVNTTVDAPDADPFNGICDSDGVTPGPQCTLRAALQEAIVAEGDDTISFDPAVSGAITLTTTLPFFSSNIIISGPGASVLSVQRPPDSGNFRIFNILAGATVSISGLTLNQGGSNNDGGGILNQGTLTISDCVLTNNFANSGGAIFNGGTLNISRTTISQNSTTGNSTAAILSQGTLTMTDSTVFGNTVRGGLFIGAGSATIANSTISNNSSETSGAGVVVAGALTTVTIVNSTITGNRADSTGGFGSTGGGILRLAGTVHLRNTIVAANFRSTLAVPDDISGVVDASSSFNLIGAGGSGGLTSGVNNNLVGLGNPGLGALADNGGPTQTHRLLSGSFAIDAGDNCVLNDSCIPSVGVLLVNDQRGTPFARSINGDFEGAAKVDIGAYEAQGMDQASPFVVSNTSDSGEGSLRNAIVEANLIGAGKVITFAEGLTGTITLLSPLPDLSSVAIEGPGASKLTVQRNSGGSAAHFRIFKIKQGSTAKITGLTISQGLADGATFETGSGGGIFNDGTLTIESCNVSGNFAGLGAGVANHGFLTILNSTIANNTSTSNGGGVGNTFADGGTSLRIDRSTISNNVANGQGGGLYHVGSPLSLITNSTISSNTAATGGGILNIDQLNLSSVTITGNNATVLGGGIRNSGVSVRFNNTIIAGNTSPSGPDGEGSNFISEDYNLIGNTSGFQLSGIITHNVHDMNPLLGSLANNGGLTKTHQLLHGSPALDAGSSTLLTDQRGRPRAVDHVNVPNAAGGDGSDIGAYEASSFEVNSTADADDGACTLPGTGNGCTLREALNAANIIPGTQAVTFAASLTASGPATITLLTALPFISTDLSLTGPGADLLTIRRSSAGGTPEFTIFSIGNFRTVSISGLTIANGKANGTGGGIINQGNLTLTGCNVYGNSATSIDGGGINNTGVSLVIKNSNIGGLGPGQGNTGGGIANITGTVVMTGGSIVGNTGVGIQMSGTTTLDGVAITNNSGTGVFIFGPTTILNSLIANNTATDDGGGVRNSIGPTKIVNTTISGNTSTHAGGGIFNGNGLLTVVNGTITNNRADSDNNGGGGQIGGGIDASFGGVRLDNTIVAGNSYGSSQTPVANDIVSLNGVNSASSFNVIGVCQTCGLTNAVNNNQVGVADAGLAPLANNGGPTLTHALLPASPALDRGGNSLVANPPFNGPPFSDQRGTGFARIVDGPDGDATATVDAGAFEQQVPVSQIENTVTKEDTQLVIPFDIGDRGSILSITVSSSNETVLPNDPAHLRLTDAGTTEIITINPVADRTGTTGLIVNVHRTGANESRAFTVTVEPVNDAPTFSRGVNQNANEDSGLHSVFNWATNVSAGPADESAQTLAFQITGNTNPTLFSIAPAISPAGTLTYTPAPNANGSALITVVLKDNGGTADGGQDTSVAQTFGITINPVNDGPANTIPFSQAVDENGSLTFSLAGANAIFVSDIDAGNAPVQVTLSTNTGVITLSGTSGLSFTTGNGTASATMTFSGTISQINTALNGMRFMPNNGFDGSASIQIVTNDGGNTGLGGPLSDTDTVLINVLNGGTLQFLSSATAVAEGASTATIIVTRTGGSAGAASVTYLTSSGTAVGGPACGAGVDFINTTGTLSWAADETTAKAFTITICDDSQNEEDEVLNLALNAPQGSGQVGAPNAATLTLSNDDAPVLLTEENTEQAIAVDSVSQTRDPFSLLNLFNLSDDHRRRVTLFVWRLGLLPGDTTANVTVVAEDSVGMTYPLTVEYAGFVPNLAAVSQVVVILPDNVIGAPRELWLTVKVRGPATNRASIRIASP